MGLLTGFFGVGGGFVIVPALALLLGLPITVAVGTSLLALTSTAALAAHLTTGGLHWGVAGAFTAAGVAGAIAGSRLGERVSSRRLREGFAVLAVAVAAFLLVENASMLA